MWDLLQHPYHGRLAPRRLLRAFKMYAKYDTDETGSGSSSSNSKWMTQPQLTAVMEWLFPEQATPHTVQTLWSLYSGNSAAPLPTPYRQ